VFCAARRLHLRHLVTREWLIQPDAIYAGSARSAPLLIGSEPPATLGHPHLKRGQLKHEILEAWWTDVGTFDSLFGASQLVREKMIEKLTARIG